MAVLLPRDNISNPKETRFPQFLGGTIPFFILMVLFYLARMYSRIRPVVKLHWDDFAITLAFVRQHFSVASPTNLLFDR
jgi:hypothetical protein